MTPSAQNLLAFQPLGRHTMRVETGDTWSASWRLAQSGGISSISRPAKAFAAPIRCIMAARGVRATRNPQSVSMGCGAPFRSSGSGCATAKPHMPTSVPIAAAATSNIKANHLAKRSAPSWSGDAKTTNGTTNVTVAPEPPATAGAFRRAAGLASRAQVVAKPATPTLATAILALADVTAIVAGVPAADLIDLTGAHT